MKLFAFVSPRPGEKDVKNFEKSPLDIVVNVEAAL